MSKNRIRKVLPIISTREEAEMTMTALANFSIARRMVLARRDAEILAINNKYAGNLADLDGSIQIEADKLQAWAESHPEEFPKGRKSIAFASGSLGFRTGQPKLALLNRKWNWVRVLAAIQDRAFSFIRSTPEVDKEAILSFVAEATDKLEVNDKVLEPIGVKVMQEESFFVEPKLTEVENRQTAAVGK